MMLLDFYSGSHGHFLEYLINVYIFQCPRVDNIFTSMGTSHGIFKDTGYMDSRIIVAGHYSEFNLQTTDPTSVVQIQISSEYGKAIYQINVDCRAGDIPTEKKKQNLPTNIQLTPHLLQNDYFSKLKFPEYGYKIPGNWRWSNPVCIYEFPMESLFDLTALYSEMSKLSNFLNHSWNPDASLAKVWSEFIEANHGVQAWKKCKNILEIGLSNNPLDFDCTPWEQALLNLMTQQAIGCLLCETNDFPKNTQEIYQIIHQHIKTFDNQY
jgi:hypothetical protein